MAKSKSTGSDGNNKGGGSDKKQSGNIMSDALRDAGQRAAELAQNPIARSMLAAGLVTAAAALTANQKVRKRMREATQDVQEVADIAADSASNIGAAIVNAATEAVRKLMSAGGGGSASSASGGNRGGTARKPAGAAGKSSTASKPAAAKKSSGTGKAKSKPASAKAGANKASTSTKGKAKAASTSSKPKSAGRKTTGSARKSTASPGTGS